MLLLFVFDWLEGSSDTFKIHLRVPEKFTDNGFLLFVAFREKQILEQETAEMTSSVLSNVSWNNVLNSLKSALKVY